MGGEPPPSYVDLLRRRMGGKRPPSPPPGLPAPLHLPHRALREAERERAGAGGGRTSHAPPQRSPILPLRPPATAHASRSLEVRSQRSEYVAPEPFDIAKATPAAANSPQQADRASQVQQTLAPACRALSLSSTAAPSASASAVRSAALRAEIDARVNKAAIAALQRAKASSQRRRREQMSDVSRDNTLSRHSASVGTQTERVDWQQPGMRSALGVARPDSTGCRSSSAGSGQLRRPPCPTCREKLDEIRRLGEELRRSDRDWRQMVHLLESELEAERRQVVALEAELRQHARRIAQQPNRSQGPHGALHGGSTMLSEPMGESRLSDIDRRSLDGCAHGCSPRQREPSRASSPRIGAQLPPSCGTSARVCGSEGSGKAGGDPSAHPTHDPHRRPSTAAEWRQHLQQEMPQLRQRLASPFRMAANETAALQGNVDIGQASGIHTHGCEHGCAAGRGSCIDSAQHTAALHAKAASRSKDCSYLGHGSCLSPCFRPPSRRHQLLDAPLTSDSGVVKRQQLRTSHSQGQAPEHIAPGLRHHDSYSADETPAPFPQPLPRTPLRNAHNDGAAPRGNILAACKSGSFVEVDRPQIGMAQDSRSMEAHRSPTCAARQRLFPAPQRLCAWGTSLAAEVASPPSSLAIGRKPPFGCGSSRGTSTSNQNSPLSRTYRHAQSGASSAPPSVGSEPGCAQQSRAISDWHSERHGGRPVRLRMYHARPSETVPSCQMASYGTYSSRVNGPCMQLSRHGCTPNAGGNQVGQVSRAKLQPIYLHNTPTANGTSSGAGRTSRSVGGSPPSVPLPSPYLSTKRNDRTAVASKRRRDMSPASAKNGAPAHYVLNDDGRHDAAAFTAAEHAVDRAHRFTSSAPLLFEHGDEKVRPCSAPCVDSATRPLPDESASCATMDGTLHRRTLAFEDADCAQTLPECAERTRRDQLCATANAPALHSHTTKELVQASHEALLSTERMPRLRPVRALFQDK